MRYQERIYIQNKYTGPRNKAMPNVSMSSDLCVFNTPTFDISGATKIGSLSGNVTDFPTEIEGSCSCPSDYTLDIDGVTCVKKTTTTAIYNGQQGSVITAGNTSDGYSLAAYFFPQVDLEHTSLPLSFVDQGANYGKIKDQNGQIITAITQSANSFWAYQNGDLSSGRLNSVGIAAYTGQWVGFTSCVNIDEPGIYYVGLAADNYCKFSLNNIEVFNTGTLVDLTCNFNIWSVFPIYLDSGANIIHMEGMNDGDVSAFGAEIYHPSSFAVLTGATDSGSTQANVIFSTRDKIGGYYDIGTTIGYSCPDPYLLSNCDDGYKCVRFEYTTCSGTTTQIIPAEMPSGVFIASPSSTIPVSFNFTGNTTSFTGTPVTFNYGVYKFNSDIGVFVTPPVFQSAPISYADFQSSNVLYDNIPISGLSLDGEYVIKGYYEFNACTDFLNRLGKTVKTSDYKVTGTYQLYDPSTDYYFIAVNKAQTPFFIASSNVNSGGTTASTPTSTSSLVQEVIPVDSAAPISVLPINFDFQGDFLLTLNGVILSNNLDYTYADNTISLSGDVTSNDVVSVIYNKYGEVGIKSDSIHIVSVIPSGSTGTQGSSNYFYNTTTGMYEIYCSLTPVAGYAIIVTINAVTLTSGIDFYQSISDTRRIILNGSLMIGDVINIFYFPAAEVINGINNTNNVIAWGVDFAPTDVNGNFTIELSQDINFESFIYTSVVSYEIGVSVYHGILKITGNGGNTLYYRIKNQKNYKTVTNNIISTISYSESVPVKITTNSINAY